jgi:DNA-binding transcriptional ArsR family regulator
MPWSHPLLVTDSDDDPEAVAGTDSFHIGQHSLYSHHMLTIQSRLDVMNRLGRAMADPTRSRILLHLLDAPGYPAQLSRDLELTRTNVSNHLACLRGCGIIVAVPEGRRTRYEIADPHLTRALESLVEVVLAVDEGDACTTENCDVPGCCADCAPEDAS